MAICCPTVFSMAGSRVVAACERWHAALEAGGQTGVVGREKRR